MPSVAYTDPLLPLLADADHIDDARAQLPAHLPDRPARAAALNRAAVIRCVSAWEAYIEELVRQALDLLRPATPPLGSWPALNASIRGQLGRFNAPNTDNVRILISDVIGLQNIHHFWSWQNCSSAQAVHRLMVAMDLRNQMAHGVNSRPKVVTFYASHLPDFFRRLSRCTDNAVRGYFGTTLGNPNPWAP